MKRTTVMLPEKLKARAETYARQHEISLGELIRCSLEKEIGAGDTSRKQDILFEEPAVYEVDVPSNLSENHDDYLYGE